MANKKEKQEKTGRRVEVNGLPKGGQTVTAEGAEKRQKWAQLVAQAWSDEKFKQRLLDQPAAVLQEHGIEFPAGVEIRVVENTEKVSNLILPAKPAGEVAELTASQMKGVVGGRNNLDGERPEVVIAVTGDTKPMGYWVVTVEPAPQSGQCYSSCVLSM